MCEMCTVEKNAKEWRQLCDGILGIGWTFITAPADGYRNPTFTYTIGLSERSHPEFIVFGLSDLEVLNTLVPLAEAVMRGQFFDEGDNLAALYPPGSPPRELLRFPDSRTHLVWANDMYRWADEEAIPALQVIPASEPGDDDMPDLIPCLD